jgi:hypothetical protein
MPAWPIRVKPSDQFGRCTAVEFVEFNKGQRWLFRCNVCSEEMVRPISSVRRNGGMACKCYRADLSEGVGRGEDNPNYRHGHRRIGDGKSSPEYYSWRCMIRRCTEPNYSGYDNYGGRGITVCDQWYKFENFLEDMGPRPLGTTLDRINPFGDYEPGNCRWATADVQARNRQWRQHDPLTI